MITETDPGGVQPSEGFTAKTKDFVTRLLPESERRDAYRECDRLLTVKDVAKQLGVCSATVYRLCDRGELPYLRIVDSMRILPLDLVAYLTRARS